ncbi:MAG TPA: phospholipase D-like domain-containing protein [Candidatus Nanoarchaeia archaeon]|nr:phospholipase D-like domain-containing protein [Candidatus Nanoarchaeia archaeon]
MKKALLCFLAVLVIASFFISDDETSPAEEGTMEVYFCPQDNCEGQLVAFLDSAQQSIHCALFDVGLESIQQKLAEKEKTIEVKVVTDNDYLRKFPEDFVKADKSGLMHNKFCIIDGQKIFTGSMNPTFNDANKNNNNLLLIASHYLAENYEAEFQELWRGIFKKGNSVKYPEITLSGIEIENYFCPDDDCIKQVVEELKQAQQSIYFLAFSFTSEEIASILLLKNLNGLEIKGVMETKQISEYSQFERLKTNGIKVIKDSNPNNLHHKVFIIDSETVITGSFNPTNGGNSRNDENILIINDRDTAKLFLQEFQQLYVI